MQLDHYKYVLMLFEITNAPTIFTTLMKTLLRKHMGTFVLVVLNDILIHSKMVEKHQEHLSIDFLGCIVFY